MASTVAQETESPTAVAEKAPATAAVASAPAVDLSAVPESPTNLSAVPESPTNLSAVPESPTALLRDWAAPAADRPNPRPGLWAVIARCWDALTGPGMTEQARLQREISEAKGFAYGYTRLS